MAKLSKADQNLKPEAQKIIKEAKDEWAKAKTDAERQAANEKANKARVDYGGYTAVIVRSNVLLVMSTDRRAERQRR